jgi:hypothetical protein
MRGLKTLGAVLTAGLLLAVIAPQARATNLNLVQIDPDALASDINIAYASFTNNTDANGTIFKFTATSSAFTQYTQSPTSGSTTVTSGTLSLTAYVYTSGVDAGLPLTASQLAADSLADSLQQKGTPHLGSPTDYFDSTDLLNMGENSNSTTSNAAFEFLFLSDSLSQAVPDNYDIGVIMTSAVSHVGLTSAFSNTPLQAISAVSNTFAVPEPSSATLLIGAAGLLSRRRRRSL